MNPEDMENIVIDQQEQIDALQKTVGCLIFLQGETPDKSRIKSLLKMLGVDWVTDEAVNEVITK